MALETAFAFAIGRFISVDSGRRRTSPGASQLTAALGAALAAAAAGAEITATVSGVRSVFAAAAPDLAYTALAVAAAMGLAALLATRAARGAPRAWAALALAAALAGSLYSAGKYIVLAPVSCSGNDIGPRARRSRRVIRLAPCASNGRETWRCSAWRAAR